MISAILATFFPFYGSVYIWLCICWDITAIVLSVSTGKRGNLRTYGQKNHGITIKQDGPDFAASGKEQEPIKNISVMRKSSFFTAFLG
jgi:hypothetical protein